MGSTPCNDADVAAKDVPKIGGGFCTTKDSDTRWTPKTTNSNAYCWKPTGCAAVKCIKADVDASPKVKDATGKDCVVDAIKVLAPLGGCTTKDSAGKDFAENAGDSPAFSVANFYTATPVTYCTPLNVAGCKQEVYCSAIEVKSCKQEEYCTVLEVESCAERVKCTDLNIKSCSDVADTYCSASNSASDTCGNCKANDAILSETPNGSTCVSKCTKE